MTAQHAARKLMFEYIETLFEAFREEKTITLQAQNKAYHVRVAGASYLDVSFPYENKDGGPTEEEKDTYKKGLDTYALAFTAGDDTVTPPPCPRCGEVMDVTIRNIDGHAIQRHRCRRCMWEIHT